MGSVKREMERQDALRNQAIHVLVGTGGVRTCEYHDEIVIDTGDDDAVKHAYAIGTNMVKSGEVDGSREEFIAAIRSAVDDAWYQCEICARAFGRDD